MNKTLRDIPRESRLADRDIIRAKRVDQHSDAKQCLVDGADRRQGETIEECEQLTGMHDFILPPCAYT
jgi:hypothetical protein